MLKTFDSYPERNRIIETKHELTSDYFQFTNITISAKNNNECYKIIFNFV